MLVEICCVSSRKLFQRCWLPLLTVSVELRHHAPNGSDLRDREIAIDVSAINPALEGAMNRFVIWRWDEAGQQALLAVRQRCLHGQISSGAQRREPQHSRVNLGRCWLVAFPSRLVDFQQEAGRAVRGCDAIGDARVMLKKDGSHGTKIIGLERGVDKLRVEGYALCWR